MKTINTNGIELLVEYIPDDATNIRYSKRMLKWERFHLKHSELFDIECRIIGLLSTINEAECERLVIYAGTNEHKRLFGAEPLYKNYSSDNPYFHATAKESLISLLQSNGIDTTKNLLLLTKN